jgi:hypothetical protein
MSFLLPIVPLLVVALVAGGKIGLLTSRTFFALTKDMAEHGHTLDRARVSDLLRKWHKKPASIVLESDPEELRAIKLAHASAFASQVKPWKIAARVATIGGAIVAVFLYNYR